VAFHIDFGENMRYSSIFIDDEGHSLGEKVSDPESAIGFGGFLVVVTQNEKWQLVFAREL